MHLNGYAPKNFNREFSGVVPFSNALSQSLNVPFVRALQDYRLEKFYDFLQRTNFKHINETADHYGLSLILGGAEASLWDVCSTYASMARTLTNYTQHNSTYSVSDFDKATWIENENNKEANKTEHTNYISAGAIWHTFKAMQKVKRPDEEGIWEQFDSAVNLSLIHI